MRRSQGSAHAFISLRTLEGSLLAVGDVVQVAHGIHVTSRLTLHFHDGSLYDDTTVYTQNKFFRLVSDHQVEHGPSFPKPTDLLVEANGNITSRTPGEKDKDGHDKVTVEHMDLPPDTANGLLLTLLTNIIPTTSETRVSMVASTGKGRLVHLSIKPDGQVPFSVGGGMRKATVYRIHIELGGITGVVAPIIGKQPEDVRMWFIEGLSPAFVKVEGQLYEGGPIWRVEMLPPVFPGDAHPAR